MTYSEDPAVATRAKVEPFAPEQLSLGLFFAIESYPGAVPSMADQLALAVRAEELGFSALWVRDVPLHDAAFGDVGQVYDPYVWLGHVGAVTNTIALGTAGLVLPLRHPLHVAKAVASVDALTGGRMLAGLSSGDRVNEYPLFGRDFHVRGSAFREGVQRIRLALSGEADASGAARRAGVTTIPAPGSATVPLLAVGSAQQSMSWVARHLDGFITYPRPLEQQTRVAAAWREEVEKATPGGFKPLAQSLYIDLCARADRTPVPIHLGYRLGTDALVDLLADLRAVGINHVLLNLKYGTRPAAEVIEDLAANVLPALAV